MTQEALKLSQEALAGLKDVEKQVRELVAENKALKEALREHAMREVQRLGQEIEQEPVAIKRMKEWIEYLKRKSDFGQHMKIPSEMSAGTCWELAIELEQFINTTPPRRTWVGMTDEEIKPCWHEACQTNLELTSQLVVYFAKAIEAKLKELNT